MQFLQRTVMHRRYTDPTTPGTVARTSRSESVQVCTDTQGIHCTIHIRRRGPDLSVPAGDITRRMLEKGFVVGTAAGNVLRIAPPLVISKDELSAFVDALAKVLA